MDIKQFAKKPELMEIILDDEDLIKTYGDKITFYIKDFVDVNTYFNFYKAQSDKNGEQLTALLQKLILNKEGQTVLEDGDQFPVDITIAALTKINECLGKSRTKSLIQEPGTQPT